MNPPLEPPPPPTAKGCCGVGCLTLFVLLAFLAFAFVGGGLWALNHFRNTYSSTEPAAIPAPESPVASAPAPTPIAADDVQARWDAFERAGRRGEKASIALSAADINTLLA